MPRYGSANILWLAMTVMVPLANFSFALKFMPDRKTLTWEDGVGLAIIMAGLLTYRFWSKFYDAFVAKYLDRSRDSAAAPLLPDTKAGSASPAMPTPMRGSMKHTGKTKKGSS